MNVCSLRQRLYYHGKEIVLGGDAYAHVWETVNLTPCDILKVPHHASFDSTSRKLLEKLEDLLDFLIPLYVGEGKSQLIIAFGCTGGKHRSVTFAELIGDYLSQKGLCVHKSHRDIQRDRA